MSDENENNRPAAPPAGTRAPLTLKPRTTGAVSSGMVKQSFSHGRTKTVVVETKRRRMDTPGVNLAERRPAPAPLDVKGPPRPAAAPAPGSANRQAGGLSEDERRARQRVIEQAARTAAERATLQAPTPVQAQSPAPALVAEPAASAPPVAAPAPVIAEAPPAASPPPETLAAPRKPPRTGDAGIDPKRPPRRLGDHRFLVG